jgi:hypothetical protein
VASSFAAQLADALDNSWPAIARPNHAAGRRGRIGPGLRKRAQARLGLSDQFGDIEQVAGRTRQPIEAVHDNHIGGAEMVEQTRQFGTVAARARDLLLISS